MRTGWPAIRATALIIIGENDREGRGTSATHLAGVAGWPTAIAASALREIWRDGMVEFVGQGHVRLTPQGRGEIGAE